jgi:hypothetical protein
VVGAAARDAQADRRDLGAAHVDARHAGAARALDAVAAQQVEHRAFDPLHQLAHAQLAAAHVEQQVGDRLARPVIGHLAAAVGAHHRDAARGEHVLGAARKPEREHRRMLEEPQLVGRVRRARRGEGLHRTPRRLVGDAPEAARDHSTMMTMGCFDSSE